MTSQSDPSTNVPPSKRDLTKILTSKSRLKILGMDLQGWIKAFFGGNAALAVIILVLICVFLFKEGAGFFPQHLQNLRIYREAGLEFVDIMNERIDEHSAMGRLLTETRLQEMQILETRDGMTREDANAALAPLTKFTNDFRSTIRPLRTIQTDLAEKASDLKSRENINKSRKEQYALYMRSGLEKEAEEIQIETIDFAAATAVFGESVPAITTALNEVDAEITELLPQFPEPVDPNFAPKYARIKKIINNYVRLLPQTSLALAEWRYDKPIPAWVSVTSFLTGKRWVTNSFWHEFYGILPLLTGSIMISIVALIVSVPFGVGAAIFVNQMAGQRERDFVKPFIEFIEAIPSVVLGFFGVIVLGEAIRQISGWDIFAWVPFFPLSDRLNIFAAGLLLALMAVPTIFTLAEDAINNVPRYFSEASLALGATKLQTIMRIIVPTALSGIIAAVLLGFGRVIGETMVVLLVAGNRIKLPDFTQGIGIFFQPTHTMTAIIAQEMGEVVGGSLHYRALFVVGIVLFLISLFVNFFAQKIVTKYRIEA